jgi:uncharacterized protein DUF4129
VRTAPSATPDPPKLTRPEFHRQLETLASEVERVEPADAARLAASFPLVERVGEQVEVRFEWLRATLLGAAGDADWASHRRDLASRLRAMRREAGELPPARVADKDARAALAHILEDRAFQRARRDSWQARLVDWLKNWLADVWDRTLGRRFGTRNVAVALAWAASIGAIVVLLIGLARAAAVRRAERPLAFGPVTPQRTAAGELAREASALARGGRVREAVRVAYRAAVHRLEEEGALRVDDARTPREYLRLLPAPHRRRPALAALTTTFERIWYGSSPPDPDEGDRIVALLRDLECLSRDHAN